PISLQRALHALRQLPRTTAAEELQIEFAGSTGTGAHREKLLWFAKRLGGDYLFPLWKSVLLRENPRIFNEDLRTSKYPDEAAALAGIEQLTAVSALSSMGAPEAKSLLQEVARNRIETIEFPPAIRLEAARELQTKDSKTYLRLAKTL